MIRIGLFTDAHYAKGVADMATRTCSRSLKKTEKVIASLKDEVDAFIELGDLINVSGSTEADLENIAEMKGVLESIGKPCYLVLGNHDVEAALKSVFLPEAPNGYYFFDMDGIRFIVLDGNYISTGESYEFVRWDWTDALIPEEEMNWLRQALEGAEKGVVVLCHQNLDSRTGDPHVVGNAAQVHELLKASGKVFIVVQGHCHHGCVTVQDGIVYHTLRALCEKDNMPCAVLTVDENGAQIEERELNKA